VVVAIYAVDSSKW